jgi:hypothetical protein
MDDPSMNPHLEANDEGFLWMQRFYAQMDEVAREVMFLPMLNMCFSFLPVRHVQTKLLHNESVEFIGDTRAVRNNQLDSVWFLEGPLVYAYCSSTSSNDQVLKVYKG